MTDFVSVPTDTYPNSQSPGNYILYTIFEIDVYGYRSLEVPSKFEQAGKVFLLSLEMLAERYHVAIPGTEYVSCFEGNLDFGRFGWHVTLQDVNNDGLSDLILGSPYQTKNVYTPKGGNIFPPFFVVVLPNRKYQCIKKQSTALQ